MGDHDAKPIPLTYPGRSFPRSQSYDVAARIGCDRGDNRWVDG
jgi:hypothetical protein